MAVAPAMAQPAPAIDALPRAAHCTASLPPFGGRGFSYVAPHGSIEMGNDGGWCWVTMGSTWQGRAVVPSARARMMAAHGAVQVGPVDGSLRIAYRPKPGFTGHDFFSVRISGFGQRDTIPVSVTVGR